MNWKHLFHTYILERGYDYYCENADMSVVRSYLTSILAENEKLLLRFHSIVKEQLTEEDVERYIAQVDDVAENYLGSSHYISYYDADAFV